MFLFLSYFYYLCHPVVSGILSCDVERTELDLFAFIRHLLSPLHYSFEAIKNTTEFRFIYLNQNFADEDSLYIDGSDWNGSLIEFKLETNGTYNDPYQCVHVYNVYCDL